MRRNQRRTLSNFAAGAIALIVTVVVVYFGFTKAIPFKHHFTISATFPTSNNLRPNSPVRIAGVAVGKVVAVQHLRAGEPGAVVKMQIDDKGLRSTRTRPSRSARASSSRATSSSTCTRALRPRRPWATATG